MGLYLRIALGSVEGSLRTMFLCMIMLKMLYDVYMIKLHIVVLYVY